jgi:chromosome segregation ATPase
MASTSETGHAKNVANFQDIIEFVTGYGTTYNPSKNSLKLPQLIALKASAEGNLADVITKNTNYNNKVNDRTNAFSGLKSLSTRLVNALQTTDATSETIGNAKTFNRKMQGKKASSGQTPTDPNTPAPTTISTSQQSYDQLIQHLSGLKEVLKAEPSYTPNETELQVEAIQTKIEELTTKNTAVATAYTAVSNSRIARNATLYAKTAGLVETALEVKKYIKSVYGATSPQYAQVKSIEFNKPRV